MYYIETQPGDRLDLICRREYGADSDQARQNLVYFNPALISLPLVLPVGTRLAIPEAEDVPALWTRYTPMPEAEAGYDVERPLPLRPTLAAMRAYSDAYSEGYR